MILASHVVISAYGFWLPNDQRGSWSDFVRSWELLRFGRATKVDHSQSVAHYPFDPALRAGAERALLYPPVVFTGLQANCIANAFADGVHRSGFRIHACAILPEHVHLIIGRHHYHVEQVVNRLKGAATRAMAAAGLHPLAEYRDANGRPPSPWGEGLWKVFLDSSDDVVRAIQYVDENPEKEGKRRQPWKFLTPHVC